MKIIFSNILEFANLSCSRKLKPREYHQIYSTQLQSLEHALTCLVSWSFSCLTCCSSSSIFVICSSWFAWMSSSISCSRLSSSAAFCAVTRTTCQLVMLTLYPLSCLILIFTHLKLWVAAATHNFKWVKITGTRLVWDQTVANLEVYTHISFPIAVI